MSGGRTARVLWTKWLRPFSSRATSIARDSLPGSALFVEIFVGNIVENSGEMVIIQRKSTKFPTKVKPLTMGRETSIKFKLTIAYDGGAYAGWQVQTTGIGVQQRI